MDTEENDNVVIGKHGKHSKPQTEQKETASEESAPSENVASDVADETKKIPQQAPAGGAPVFVPIDETAVMPQSYPEQNYLPYSRSSYGSGMPSSPSMIGQSEGAFKPQMPYGDQVKKKKKGGKVAAIAAGSLAALIVVVYGGVSVYFADRFFPNTRIGDVNVSLMTADEAANAISSEINDYSLNVSGEGFDLDLTAQDAGINVDSAEVVDRALSDNKPYAWILHLNRSHNESKSFAASFDEVGLKKVVEKAVETFNKDAQKPKDATVKFDESAGKYVVVDERDGNALSSKSVVEKVQKAVAAFETRVKLTDEDLLKPKVTADDKRLNSAVKAANKMISSELTFMMADDKAATLDSTTISDWVTLDKKLNATLDGDKLTAWVEGLAEDCNTVGKSRTYTRRDGKKITVSGGVYGWSVDQEKLLKEVKAAVKDGKKKTISIPCSTEGDAYKGPGKRDWGKRYIDIDLAEQHVYFYNEKGKLVWESDCISGKPDGSHDTSVGVFWLNQKESPSKLIGYENGEKQYETTVEYWMPFDGNGIGLHDASWQPGFGGDMYKEGYGSHGCVNLPVGKAAELYDLIEPGDTVVSHW